MWLVKSYAAGWEDAVKALNMAMCCQSESYLIRILASAGGSTSAVVAQDSSLTIITVTPLAAV